MMLDWLPYLDLDIWDGWNMDTRWGPAYISILDWWTAFNFLRKYKRKLGKIFGGGWKGGEGSEKEQYYVSCVINKESNAQFSGFSEIKIVFPDRADHLIWDAATPKNRNFKALPPGGRGGRLTSLAWCLAFWRTSSKTLTSMFFSKTSPKHRIVKGSHPPPNRMFFTHCVNSPWPPPPRFYTIMLRIFQHDC